MKSLILSLLVASVGWSQISVTNPAPQAASQVLYGQVEKTNLSTLGPWPTDGSDRTITLVTVKKLALNTILRVSIKGTTLTPFDSIVVTSLANPITINVGADSYNTPNAILVVEYWSLTK